MANGNQKLARWLDRGVVVLETLDYCREKYDEPAIGRSLEETIISTALQDIELCTRLAEVDEEIRLSTAAERARSERMGPATGTGTSAVDDCTS